VSDEKNTAAVVLKSPGAAIVWWVWLLFAAANLIDLAVQGHDHLSLVAALILLLITGVAYVTARRPGIAIGDNALTIVNALRDHRIDWATITMADTTELLRVRCEWPDGEQTRRRAIYSWAIHTPRRKQLAAELRAKSRGSGGAAGLFGLGTPTASARTGQPAIAPASDPFHSDPLKLDVDKIAATITQRAEEARAAASGTRAAAPVSTWNLTAVAALALPALALLIIALA
jgi:hypothetical protein